MEEKLPNYKPHPLQQRFLEQEPDPRERLYAGNGRRFVIAPMYGPENWVARKFHEIPKDDSE